MDNTKILYFAVIGRTNRVNVELGVSYPREPLQRTCVRYHTNWEFVSKISILALILGKGNLITYSPYKIYLCFLG